MPIPFEDLAQVAAKVGVNYCDGTGCGGCMVSESRRDHDRGFVVVSTSTVHMSERRVIKSVIRRFALLAADITIGPEVEAMPPWKATWLRCSIAEEICRLKLHVRIPNAYWNLDRWAVKAQLAQVEDGVPQRIEAMAWTRLAK